MENKWLMDKKSCAPPMVRAEDFEHSPERGCFIKKETGEPASREEETALRSQKRRADINKRMAMLEAVYLIFDSAPSVHERQAMLDYIIAAFDLARR